ncbi:MAG: aldo/keto reductase [Polyangiaceae bacterium]|nr:aldo/keto reductase [Polyangiaceae bacterium]
MLATFTQPKNSSSAASIALGAMNFGKRTSAADAEKIMARAVERGVSLFDTANVYVDGQSEEIVGRFIKSHPGKVAVATKVGLNGFFSGKAEGLSKQAVLSAADQSLKRLGIDTIDIYYLHAPDHNTPIEETLSAVSELLQKNKIRNFGVSNYASWQIVEIFHACDTMGITRPVIAQQIYNLLIRQLDIEYARFARKYKLHTTVYNALAGGMLSGKYLNDRTIEKGSRFDKNRLYLGRYWNDRLFDLVASYAALAEKAGMSLTDLSYAWLAGSNLVDSVLVGPATIAHLDAACDGLAKTLSNETRAEIDSLNKAFLATDTTYAR